jgi:hypothetical protein
MDRLADALVWLGVHLLGLVCRVDRRLDARVDVNDLTDDIAILPGRGDADFGEARASQPASDRHPAPRHTARGGGRRSEASG